MRPPPTVNGIAPPLSALVATIRSARALARVTVGVRVARRYWDRRFPRLLSNEQLATMRRNGDHRLLAVADLTCDVEGAIECLTRTSTVDDPFYVYDPIRRQEMPSLEDDGVLMLGTGACAWPPRLAPLARRPPHPCPGWPPRAARPRYARARPSQWRTRPATAGVDILPAELPREASAHFGEALLPFLDGLAAPGAALPAELATATIAERGELTAACAHASLSPPPSPLRQRWHGCRVDACAKLCRVDVCAKLCRVDPRCDAHAAAPRAPPRCEQISTSTRCDRRAAARRCRPPRPSPPQPTRRG